ncbi:hypothetical protein EJ08DRAFT_647024 [Tothia fuscella]|uniref:Uncharacterized protein n=1 Tax=Tothia fuscella TaxID=1048955 RepID=A0A9P4NXY6_9PEZI|nr:hypothetical protein EJ08DRAFT_647024 [Tothia fuscella]
MQPKLNIESGQIYHDTTVSAPRISIYKWLHQSKGSDKAFKRSTPSRDGTRSLLDMATRIIIRNRDALNEENLGCVPWSIARSVWVMLWKNELVSLSIWMLFAKLYYCGMIREAEAKKQFHMQRSERIPDELVTRSIDYLKGKHLDFVTVLELRYVIAPRVFWVGLCQIPTLRVLAINEGHGNENTGFGTEVVKAWSRQAEEADGFLNLKALVLRDLELGWLTLLDRIRLLRWVCFRTEGLGCSVPYNWVLEEQGVGPRTMKELILHPLVQQYGHSPAKAFAPSRGEVDRLMEPTLSLKCGQETSSMDMDCWIRRVGEYVPHELKRKAEDDGSVVGGEKGRKVQIRNRKQKGMDDSLADFGFGFA